jgi:hypothetical protein
MHRACANDRLVFVSRAIDGRRRVSAVVANEVQHIHAVQQSPFSVRVVMPATRHESNERFQSSHARLHGNFLAAFCGRFWP